MNKSKCCNANVKLSGMPDFVGDNDICTFHYECEKRGNACDIESTPQKKSNTMFVQREKETIL